MNNNHPPFRVGQRVVALKASGNWKKGDQFLVLAIQKPCCIWTIDIGERIPYSSYLSCPYCNDRNPVKEGSIWWTDAGLFAPIDPLYGDITKELAEKGTTEETPDAVRVRELN